MASIVRDGQSSERGQGAIPIPAHSERVAMLIALAWRGEFISGPLDGETREFTYDAGSIEDATTLREYLEECRALETPCDYQGARYKVRGEVIQLRLA